MFKIREQIKMEQDWSILYKDNLGYGKGKDIMKKQYIKRFLATALTGIILLTNTISGNAMDASRGDLAFSQENVEIDVADELVMEDEGGDIVTPTMPDGKKIEDMIMDPNFAAYIKAAYDTDGNGYMTEGEINNVRVIDVTEKSIGSLAGIENFKNLETLLCGGNGLSALVLTGNTKLTRLECQKNNIPTLDLSKNTRLTKLNCSNNIIGTLNIEGCAELKEIDCSNNLFSELPIQYMSELTTLNCSNNASLTSLDVQNNTKLKVLNCAQCDLGGLSVKRNSALEELYCSENRIEALDLQNNKQLKWLECNNNTMKILNLSECERLQYVKCSANQISVLNVQKSTPLTTLNCKDNNLTQLDVRNNKQLNVLNVDNNNLLSLDVSQNPALTELYCDNNKRTVDSPIVDLGQDNLFDVTKVSALTNATINENGVLRFVDVGFYARYKYEVKEGEKIEFTLETTGSFKSMASVNVENIEEQEFTGTEISPKVALTDGGRVLEENTDYQVQYLNNVNAGTATVQWKGMGSYDGILKKEFKIVPKNIKDIDEIQNYEIHAQVYTGNAITPELTLTYGDNTLKYGTDYVANYSDNFKIGQAKVEIIGKGNYTGSTVKYFNIEPKHIGKAVMKPIDSVVYTGQPITPAVILEDSGVLEYNVDYTFTYEDNVNAGIAKIRITGMGNYGKETVETFVIEPRSLSKFQVEDLPESLYDGEEKKPTVTVYDTELEYELVKDKDYQVTYKDNVNAGTAKAVITGIGNYKGTIEKEFIINVKSEEYVSVDAIANQEYTAREIKPEIRAYDGERRLVQGKDYSLAFSANTALGTGKVEVILQGNYSGIINKSFKIVPRNLENVDIEGVKDVYFSGEKITQTVSLSHNSTVLTEDTDYQIVYRDNVEVGKAKVLITGKGNYTGTRTLEYNILQCPIKKVKADYEKDFLYDGEKKEPSISLTLGGYELEVNKDYVFEYLDNVNAGKGKIVVKGRGDFSGEYTWEFTIAPRKVKNFQIEEIPTQVYTGKDVMPDVFVTDGELEVYSGRDYLVTYGNNLNQGMAWAKITGIGNYTGEETLEFQIEPREVKWVELVKIPQMVYTGTEITPEIVYMNGEQILEEGKDYKLTYKDNVNAGIATVCIEGMGNYTGERRDEFEIQKKNVEALEFSYEQEFEYTGKMIEPNVAVVFPDTKVVTMEVPESLTEEEKKEGSSFTLTKNQDYIVRYYNNQNAGTGEIQIEGIGNYQGIKHLKFTIAPKNLNKAKVSMTTRFKYTGKTKNPYLLVMIDGKILFEGQDYTKNLKNNKKVGQATILLTGKNNYTGVLQKKFVIYPRTATIKKLSSKNGKVTIQWLKRSECTGYVVEYAQDKGFVVNKKTKTIKTNKTTNTTIKKLIPGVKYYYRVRGYTVVNGKRVYGNYSAVRSVKVK